MDKQEIIKRVVNIYPQASPKIEQAYNFLKEYFIDKGFAKYYWTIDTNYLSSIKNRKENPNASDTKRLNQERNELNKIHEEKRNILKPLVKQFLDAMKNPFLVLLFSFMTINDGLLNIIEYNETFRAVFDLTFKIDTPIDPSTAQGTQKIKNIVMNFGKSPEPEIKLPEKQPEIKLPEKRPEIKLPEKQPEKQKTTPNKKTNRWVEHVRAYAKSKNISYACAISEASKTYKK